MRHVGQKNSKIIYLSISDATSGDSTIVAAVPGNNIVVLSYHLVAAGAVTVQFKSASTALTGAMTMATGVPLTVQSEEYGVFQTTSGEALVLTLGGNVQVSGHICYIVSDQVVPL